MRSNRHERPRSHAERLASRDGYFAPESVIRRVGNTPVTPFLGGGAAVLLQVAHPLVAAGVAAHSTYERDIWKRLVGTLRALYLVTYGSRDEAERAGNAVRTAHRYVHGRTGTALGPFPAGTPYSAEDPQLMLWVHATLVYASLAAYRRFERRLSEADQERYHREMTVVAELFGLPARFVPATLAGLRDYFAAQVGGEAIAVTEPARAIARAVLHADLPQPLRLITPAHRLATTALLPPRVRDAYGLELTPLRRPLVTPTGRALRLGARPALRLASHLRPSSRLISV
jgi:uncharacterized protein (DUF2236 family)